VKTEYSIPLAMLALAVGAAASATYGGAQGPWFVAVYPASNKEAFASAAPYADAIAADDKHSVTLAVSDPEKISALRQSGAILLDPKGIPLCSRR
jgi:hypothetical protein